MFDSEGRHYLHNRYGIDVGMEDFNRVVYQRLGHGDFWFRYGAVEAEDGADLPLQERPAFRCWVKERNGYPTVYIYNAVGNLLRKEEIHKQSGGRSTRAVWRFRHNRDGQLVASRSPEGVVTHVLTGRDHFYRVHGIDPNLPGAEDELWRHDSLTATERRGFARVLATVNRARHHTGTLFDWSDRWGDIYQADGKDIIVKHTFEPAYGQLRTTSDPRATTSADPRAIEPSEYERLLTRYEYDGPAGDPTRDLVQVIAPTPTLPDGTSGSSVVMRVLARDPRGRVTRSVDAVGTEVVTAHFATSAGTREGFVERRITDPGDAAAGHLNIATEHEVDELGRVTATRLPRGVESADGRFIKRATYDALDRVIAQRGPTPLDFETRTEYEPAGKPKRIEVEWRAPDGTLRDVMVRRFKYDEEHRVVKETWGGEDIAAHFRIAHKYDASGTLRVTMAANDTTVHFRYDSRDQLVKTIRSYGVSGESVETLVRDRDGRVVAKRSGEGRTEYYELDVFGRVIAITDPLGHITRTSYDKAGRPTVVRRFERRGDGSYWLIARSETKYDELGRAIASIANRFDEPLPATDVLTDYEAAPGPGGRVEALRFLDAAGRVVREIDPLGHTTTTSYDAAGRVISITDAMGNRVESRFDAHGNVIRKDRFEIVRDIAGNVIGQEVLSWSGTYDERDRLVRESEGLGNVTEHRYDSLDRKVFTRDPLGNVMEAEFDIYGRLVSQSSRRTDNGLGTGAPLPPATVRFERDRSGNLTAQVDALGRRTEYRLDRSNRVIEQVFPDGARVATRYDRDDLITAVRDAHGVVLLHDHDDAGRLVRTVVDDSEIDPGVALEGARFVERRYDGLNRLTLVRNEAVSILTQFDSLGLPVRDDTTVAAAGALALALDRRFDDSGRVAETTYPGGRVLRWERDALGRLRQIVHTSDGIGYPGATFPTPRVLGTFAYAGARLREVARANGTTTTILHDAGGRRVEIDHTSPAGTILRVQRLHDGARNPRLQLEAQATTTAPAPASALADRFGFDSEYQLAARASDSHRPFANVGPFAPPSVPQEPVPYRQPLIDAAVGGFLPPAPSAGADVWTYDLAGNRALSRDENGTSHAYVANNRDQYESIDGVSRTYDRAGNLRSDGRFEYRYDAWRRLCLVTNATTGAAVVRYTYDPTGRCVVEESAVAAPLVIAYDGGHRIADFQTGTCLAQYVHGEQSDDPIHLANGGIDAWYHCDHQRSVRNLTDGNATVIASYEYDAFGNLLEQTGAPLGTPVVGTVAQPFGFGSRPFDARVEVYDQRARTFSPASGRFLQRDPAGVADGTNLYMFAGNQPLAFGDPTGLSRRDVEQEAHDAARDRMEATPIYQSLPWYEEAKDFALREVAPRAVGAVRVASAVALTQAGAALVAVPGAEWAAPIVVALAADQAQAGLRQMWSGEPTRSNLNTAVEAVTGSQWFADTFEGATLGAAGGATTALLPRNVPPGVVPRGGSSPARPVPGGNDPIWIYRAPRPGPLPGSRTNPQAARTPGQHVWGREHLPGSPFESWTTKRAVAEEFARRRGTAIIRRDLRDVAPSRIAADLRTAESRAAAAARETEDLYRGAITTATDDAEIILWRRPDQ